MQMDKLEQTSGLPSLGIVFNKNNQTPFLSNGQNKDSEI